MQRHSETGADCIVNHRIQPSHSSIHRKHPSIHRREIPDRLIAPPSSDSPDQ
ncbi:hypothetical protein BDV19DRAFT_214202 [Aspergillus venezuelensis]